MATQNGGVDEQANEELRREYHDLQNKITRNDINASQGLDIANEKLDRVRKLVKMGYSLTFRNALQEFQYEGSQYLYLSF